MSKFGQIPFPWASAAPLAADFGVAEATNIALLISSRLRFAEATTFEMSEFGQIPLA
jgi:hypothetical protein